VRPRTEWPELSVADLQRENVLLVEDGNHGEYRPRTEEFSESEGVAFVRAADLDKGRVRFESVERITETALKRIRKGIGAPGDVLLSHKGTVGKVALTPLDCEPFICSPQTTFWRVLDASSLDRRYLFYYLCSPLFRRQLDARKGETDMADYVSLTAQRRLKIQVPPLVEQEAIAGPLGTLDDKIELNQRMVRTLHETAWTVFAARYLRHPERERWPLEPLAEHVEAVRGLSYTGAGLSEGEGLPLHNLDSVYEGGGYKREGIKWYLGEYKERHLVRPGDVVGANTEQGFEYLLIAYPAIIPKRFGELGLFSHHLYRLRPRPGSPLSAPRWPATRTARPSTCSRVTRSSGLDSASRPPSSSRRSRR